MGKRVTVTGGAGFIGSHLVDELLGGDHRVEVVDDLSSSTLDRIEHHVEDDRIEFHRRDPKEECDDPLEGIDTVFHFAAASDVRRGNETPREMYEDNVSTTFNVLEACRKNGVDEVVFASSSTVYGEADEIPTPEDHEIDPISLYGSTKAACESLIRSYSRPYGLESTILRYANVFGPRSDKGVMYDFFHKLKENPSELEIMGDGKQEKSYLHIDDCVDGTLRAWTESSDPVNVFNVGSDTQLTVDEVADHIAETMGLSDVGYRYTGGERGWKGDVPVMLLDTSKLERLGWERKVEDFEGIERYVEWLEETY